MDLLNTDKYTSKKHDLVLARGRIILFAAALALLTVCGWLVFLSGYGWGKPVGVIVGFILLIVLIQTPYFISVHLESGKNLVHLQPAERALPISDYAALTVSSPQLRVIGEGIRVRSLETAASADEAKWEIKVFFTAFNDAAKPFLLYDMHARSYCRWYELIPDISLVLKGRQEVTLSSDNSILHEGKVFEVDPHDNMSFSLSLEVSRVPGDDWTMVVFGIFTDFHEPDGGGAICFPVDCVFCFLNLPSRASASHEHRVEAFHVNSRSIVSLWERHYRDPAWRRVMKVIDTALELQLSSLRRHV